MTATSTLAAIVVGLTIAPTSAQTAAELLQKGLYTQDTIGDIDGALRIARDHRGAGDRDTRRRDAFGLTRWIVEPSRRAASRLNRRRR